MTPLTLPPPWTPDRAPAPRSSVRAVRACRSRRTPSGSRERRGESTPARSERARALPPGYHIEHQSSGLSLPVPDGWKGKELDGGEVVYVDPSGLAVLEHRRTIEEAQTRRDNPGHVRVRMEPTTVRGGPGGYWEFTFDGRVRNFRVAEVAEVAEVAFADTDGTQYVVHLSAPDEQWSRYRPVFDTAVVGLRLGG
ncbi:hypothetical protein [Streptomyces sp. NBC_00273]|uniref:hypothetical protein n=1 Tax=Streptomyces sp. NBC_00273 TaxID=2903644 RepID=UPI002E2ACCFB|nr:hypothetical protein [Streptomyces sp. NBC_00273]